MNSLSKSLPRIVPLIMLLNSTISVALSQRDTQKTSQNNIRLLNQIPHQENRIIAIKQKVPERHSKFITQQQLQFAIQLIQNLNGKVVFNHQLAQQITSTQTSQYGAFQFVNSHTEEEKLKILQMIQKQKDFYASRYSSLIQSPIQQHENHFQTLRSEHYKQNIWSEKQKTTKEKQLPFCVVVPSYNNAKQQFYKKNLDSILQQQYTNYRIIYIDDASQDNTTQHVIEYLKDKFPSSINSGQGMIIQNKTFYKENIITIRDFEFNRIRWKFLFNQYRRKALFNIWNSVVTFCNDNQIVIVIDGDDAFVGTQTFKLLNRAYQQTEAMFIYTSYALKKDFYLNKNRKIKEGQDIVQKRLSLYGMIIRQYKSTNEDLTHHHPGLEKITSYEIGPAGIEVNIHEIKSGTFRRNNPHLLASHILSYYTSLMKKVPPEQFMIEPGKFLESGTDTAQTLSLAELAYKRTYFLKEVLYNYQVNSGINISPQSWSKSSQIVRKMKPNKPLSDEVAQKMVKMVLDQ